MKAFILILALAASTLTQAANYKGSIRFSSQEIRKHKRSMPKFLNLAKGCLEDYERRHIEFYRSNCIVRNGKKVCLSKFYGDRRYSKKRRAYRADGKKLTYLPKELRKSGFRASLAKQMESTSCVGMTLVCLGKAFEGTNQGATWKRIRDYVRLNGTGGTALQKALRTIGWKIFYWNPEPLWSIEEATKAWDKEEENWQSKGWHHYRYRSVMNKNRYWFNVIDDKYTMVGFDRGTPQVLDRVPFWVGTAHTGYHVFPGTYDRVIEAHSTRHITAYDNLEFSQFAPMKTGGGPRWTRTEKYRSGMIALPPGY